MDVSMDASVELRPGRLFLILAPRPVGCAMMNSFAARLALNGAVHMLDSGNWFNAHAIAREVRSQTARLPEVLGRVQVRRAFTCYQIVALLNQQPAGSDPLLVLDFLATFADESVPLCERARLLDQALVDLKRLSARAPAAVGAVPVPAGTAGMQLPAGHPARFVAPLPSMLARLEEAADQVDRFMPPDAYIQARFC